MDHTPPTTCLRASDLLNSGEISLVIRHNGTVVVCRNGCDDQVEPAGRLSGDFVLHHRARPDKPGLLVE